ncbi:hypothetical protein ABZ863_25260 [Saccharomonospora sp. NPDC046836]|uniref:hypothetical protein n=1 Tax=Saccharomonospora sp. NPDC046836 TaxID=3156921 RepID=UPI0033FA291E
MPQVLLTRRTPRRYLLALGAVLLGLLTISPIARPGTLVKDERFITAQTTGILDIEPGECFTDPTYEAAAGEEVVRYRPCDEGAANQAYGFLQAAEGPFVLAELVQFGWARCHAEFVGYWGEPEKSGLDFYPILPTVETWADGDRIVMCVVYSPGGELTRSAVPLY